MSANDETQNYSSPANRAGVKPVAPVPIGTFVDTIIDLELATKQQIETCLSELPEPTRADTSEVAKHLRKKELLTPLQAKNIADGRGDMLKVGEDYVLMEPLGKGGMGEVFKALHKTMAREVAIKFVALQVAKDPDALARFQREVRAAAKLIHPNIVTAFDAGIDRKRPYLVMECVAGKDMSRILEKHPNIPIRQAIMWIEQAASGLACAHENGIVHRDIKPQNLLIDPKGQVKILDLGLARIAADIAQSRELTASGTVMGTADYMAPEQASDAKNVDHRADIYSLGCTLYRILTGRAPFETDSMVNTLVAHRTKPIPSLKAARPDVPDELERLYQKMMAKRPQDRVSSMNEVIGVLHELQSNKAAQSLLGPDTANPHAITLAPQASVPHTFPSPLAPDKGRGVGGEGIFSTLDIDLASIDMADPNANTIANIPTPGVTVVGYPQNPYWQTQAKKKSNTLLILFGTLGGILAVGLLGLLGYAIVQLSNRKPDTIVIKEQTLAPEPTKEPALPPLPDPFSDRAAAEWALALGGKVRVLEPNKESYDVWHAAGLPTTEFRVEGISLDSIAAVTDTSIAQVRELTALRDLSVANTAITDAGLVYLKSLASLRVLNVQGCKLSDKALETLSARTELATLIVGGNLTDMGIKSLHPLGKLTSASFTADGPTGASLESLVKFSPNLGTLLTENFKVNDNDVSSLKSLGNLRVLGLINAPLTDGCVEKLSELKNLTQLIIQGTQVSADGLRRLQASLPNCKIYGGTYNPRRNAIRRILMAGGKVTYSSVGIAPTQLNNFNDLPEDFIVQAIDFEGVRPLQLDGMSVEETSELILTDSGIGLTDLRRVAVHFPLLTELKVDGTLVPDNELTMFAGLKSLQLLDATRTAVTAVGANQLKQAIPNCDVMIGELYTEKDQALATWALEQGSWVNVVQGYGRAARENRIESQNDLPNGPFGVKSFWVEKLKPGDEARFVGLKSLAWVGGRGHIDDEAMMALASCPKMQEFVLYPNGTSTVTDKSLLAFGRKKKLTTVYLMGNQQITDAGLIGLGKHPELRNLVLSGGEMKLTGQSIDRISEQFPNVSILWVTPSVPLSISTYERIASIKSLSDVSIGNLTDQQIVPFRSHPEIKKLSVGSIRSDNAKFTDAGIESLMTIPNLQQVSLDRTAITSRGLTKLLKHPNLKVVSLSGTALNFKEAIALKDQHPNITIRLDPKHWGAYQHILHGAKLTISISGRARKEISTVEEIPNGDFAVHKLDAKGCKGPDYNELLYMDTYKFAELEEIVFEDSTVFDGGYLVTSNTGPWNGFANLRILNLNNVRNLNDVRLQALKDTSTLVRLSVKGTRVTEAGGKQLSQSLPFCTIEWDGGLIQGKKQPANNSKKGKK